MEIFELADYWHWLETVRFGEQALTEAQRRKTSEDDRRAMALNITIAYAHLIGDDASPFKEALIAEDLRAVRIAEGVLAEPVTGRLM